MQKLTPEQLSGILSHFVLDGQVLSAKPFGNGHINDTFLVSTDRVPAGYVLQRISSAAFPRPVEVMENVCGVTGHLQKTLRGQGGDPARETLTLLDACDGTCWHIDERGDCWRVYVNITGTKSFQLPESEDIFREAGRAFGAFQQMLENYPAATLHETIPHFHDTPARVAALEKAMAEDKAGRLHEVETECAFALARREKAGELMRLLEAGELPLRVTHNDTKLNNVLMDEATGKGLCVIDLDTVMPGLSAFDFGDAIRFGANTAEEDEADLTKVHLSLPMFRAYAEGYLATAGAALTPVEKRVLPLGAWMMTYECGIRFLADHLNGDVYFHIAYPGHNLVRARNQFALVADMEAHEAEMDAIIASL